MSKTDFEVEQHQLFVSPLNVIAKLFASKERREKSFLKKRLKIWAVSAATLPFQILEGLIYDRKIKKTQLHSSPVFIIGHWRSGTTHLHYLLTQDRQFGYLSNFQAFLFNVSLLGGKRLKHFVRNAFPDKRPQDNMQFGPDLPNEEELPLSNISHRSGYHSMWFPKDDSFFKKYVLFENISLKEKDVWKKDYLYLLKKIAFYQKKDRLILKNPFNSARISVLLELFPDAKFIHLYRNPFDVYASTLHWYDQAVRSQFLQSFSDQQAKEKTLKYYKLLMRQFLEQRALITSKSLIEINFEDLVASPIAILQEVYKKFELGDFEQAKKQMALYLDQNKDYQTNQYYFDSEELEQVKREWAFAFLEWDIASDAIYWRNQTS